MTYDEGNVTSVIAPDYNESYTYDDTNMLTAKVIGDHSYTFTHKDTAAEELESVSVNGSVVRPATDVLGRHTGKTIEVGGNKIAEEKITYAKFGDHATSLPASVRFATNGEFRESMQYRYDSMGNIIEVSENGRMVCRYELQAKKLHT